MFDSAEQWKQRDEGNRGSLFIENKNITTGTFMNNEYADNCRHAV